MYFDKYIMIIYYLCAKFQHSYYEKIFLIYYDAGVGLRPVGRPC